MIRTLSLCCHLALSLLLLIPQELGSTTLKDRAEALVRQGLAVGEEEIADAVPHYRRALELFDEAGDLRGAAECELFLATVEREQDNPDGAIDLYRASRARLRAVGDPIGVWMLLMFQGEAELDADRCRDAILTLEEGLDEIDRIAASPEIHGIETLMAYSRQSYCPNASAWGSFSGVNPLIYRMAISAFESLNLGLAADAHRMSGNLETALAVSQQALDIIQGLPLVDRQASVHRKMGLMHLSLGRHAPAAEHLGQALALVRKAAHWEVEVAILQELADVERRRGRPEAALQRYEEILEIAELMDAVEILAETYREMSEGYLEMGREQEARDYRERAAEMVRTAMDRK